ncbi:oligosaccharide flippase family protein [SAR92 clade bacterium H246]
MSQLFTQARALFRGSELKARALRGSTWTVIGYSITQATRLGSNLILTRILFPEAFGLMAIIQVFIQGLAMFSDMGIGPSIIQNKKGNYVEFLNTAWTIQVIRGFVLFLACGVMAFPLGVIYDSPSLAYLLPVAGISAAIAGFNPTKLVTANRNLALGWNTIVEIISQLLSVILLIGLALWLRSVWALVIGGVITSFLKLILIHQLVPGPRNRFAWDNESLGALVGFGKWVFLSSVVGFFVQQGDKLVLAAFMTNAELGIYSIAFVLASAAWALSSKLNQLIFFPIYSELQDLGPEQLRPKVTKARLAMCSLLLPPLILLILFGDRLVMFLYDQRYWDAGWMVQVLSLGYAISVGTNIGPFHLGQGKSKLFMILITTKAIILAASMYIGGFLYGMVGVVIGVAGSNFIFYLVSIGVYQYFGLWLWRLDIAVLLIIGAALVIIV